MQRCHAEVTATAPRAALTAHRIVLTAMALFVITRATRGAQTVMAPLGATMAAAIVQTVTVRSETTRVIHGGPMAMAL